MKTRICQECGEKFQYDEISLYDGVEFIIKQKGYKEKGYIKGWRKVGRAVNIGHDYKSVMCRRCERIYREGRI